MTEMTYDLMQDRYPAIVRSYDQARRTANTRPSSKSCWATRAMPARLRRPSAALRL